MSQVGCLSRTKKSSNRNLLYHEMSTRSRSNLVLRVPISFYSYTCNTIYKLIVSKVYTAFLNHNLLYQVMSTRSGSHLIVTGIKNWHV